MIKLSSFRFLALCACASLSLFACSDDKSEPNRQELCSAKPITRDCLVGDWNFLGVYESSSVKSTDCPQPGSLELRANGDYVFTGGVWNQEVIGTWTFDGTSIVVTNDLYDVYEKSGTITVDASSSNNVNMAVTAAAGQYSAFAHCSTHKIEKFTAR